MSVARITTFIMESKELADASVQIYSSTAPDEFPEAEQLLQIRTDDNTVVMISLYENEEAMERAPAHMSSLASVVTKVGTVELNHSNDN